MLLKFFSSYPYVVYSIIGWGYIFVFIGVKGFKRLWPISILSALILFVATYWLINVGLYKSSITFLPIFGIPFFFILWGAASGIVFANYFYEKTYQRILSILGFSALTLGFEKLVELIKKVEHVGKFTDAHEYVFDVFVLSTLAFLMTNLFGNRLRKDKNCQRDDKA